MKPKAKHGEKTLSAANKKFAKKSAPAPAKKKSMNRKKGM
jgi:hypothetical protein